MNIKRYLINILVLPIVIIVILLTILMGVSWDPKTLHIASDWFAITSFVFIVVVVGLILQYNPPDRTNWLVKCKERISSWVEPHKHLKWLQGDRAVEFSLLYVGIAVGLCGLGLQLWLDYVSLC